MYDKCGWLIITSRIKKTGGNYILLHSPSPSFWSTPLQMFYLPVCSPHLSVEKTIEILDNSYSSFLSFLFICSMHLCLLLWCSCDFIFSPFVLHLLACFDCTRTPHKSRNATSLERGKKKGAWNVNHLFPCNLLVLNTVVNPTRTR